MKIIQIFLFYIGAFIPDLFAASQPFPYSKLLEVSFQEVKINDDFWLPRIKMVQDITLPSLVQIAEEQGKIDNFRIVSGRKKGKLKLYNAPDSDVYKLIEAAGYALSNVPNKVLEKLMDSIIDEIVAAQAPSGYLHTQYMLPFNDPASPSPDNKNVMTFGFGPENQWKSVKTNWPYAYSQLYCAGHLMEAGVAYFKGTGKRALLDAAIRFADLICWVFDAEKVKTYADHPEVEIGLMELYGLTGNQKYLKMADLFSRYVNFSRPVDINAVENSRPLSEQSEAYGHCVRTAYIYSGATDVVRAWGATDLQTALFNLQQNIVGHKMYIHGGTGNGTKAEQHGHNDDLPIGETYSECCANIAQGQWNHRLNLLTGNASFADIVEIESFNSALSGISSDGDKFFYSNKINIDTLIRKNQNSGVRSSYLFCCPSKLPGFVAGIGRWVYAKDNKGIYINQFIGSEVKTRIGESIVSVRQETGYPYSGKDKITVLTEGRFVVNIRIPSWAKGKTHLPGSPYCFHPSGKTKFQILINGEKISNTIAPTGYISIDKKWESNDLVEIEFEMPVQRVYTRKEVSANSGRVALMRGPLLYCLESVDHDFNPLDMVLPAKNRVVAKDDTLLHQKIISLSGEGLIDKRGVTFKAIPYFLWENRGIGQMEMLIIENPKKSVKPNKSDDNDTNTNG